MLEGVDAVSPYPDLDYSFSSQKSLRVEKQAKRYHESTKGEKPQYSAERLIWSISFIVLIG